MGLQLKSGPGKGAYGGGSSGTASSSIVSQCMQSDSTYFLHPPKLKSKESQEYVGQMHSL
eukprot:2774083-Amphidinium_carterae.1